MLSRSLVSRALFAIVVVGELLARAYGADHDARIVRADFGVSAGVAAVVSLLSGLFNMFSGKKTDFGAAKAIEGVRTGVTDLGKKLTEMIVGVAGSVSSVLGVVRRFLQKVFGKLYDMLANLVKRIARILDKVFGPIINFLDKVKLHLKKFYDKVLRPIIDTIEFVRGILRLLSFFNIDWAKKLDQQLQKLEQYVLAPYEFLVTKLNEVSNWINRIVTLDGLLQRVTLLSSLVRDVAYTNNLWWNSQLRPENALPPGGGGFEDDVSADTVIGNLERHFASGSSEMSPLINETVASIQISLRRAA